MKENKSKLKTLITKADESIVFNQVHAIIKNNIVKKVGRLPAKKEVPLEMLAEFFTGGVIQLLKWWLTSDANIDSEDLKKELFGIVKTTIASYYYV